MKNLFKTAQPKELLELDLKKKIIIIFIIFIVLIFSVVFYIIIPTVKDIVDIKDEIEYQRVDLENKYMKGQNIKMISEKLKKIEGKIDVLDNIFVNSDESLEFIMLLENRAGSNGVNQKINLLPSEEDNNFYKKISLQLFTQGDLINQLRYLISLEELEKYINIKSLEISQGAIKNLSLEGASMDGENVNMFILADTYWK